nr:hypothetical protein [Tanacetum cinerariifolium]
MKSNKNQKKQNHGGDDGSMGDNGVVSVEMMGLTVVAVVDMVAAAVGFSGVGGGVVMEMWWWLRCWWSRWWRGSGGWLDVVAAKRRRGWRRGGVLVRVVRKWPEMVAGGSGSCHGGAWRWWLVDWIDRDTGNIFGVRRKI